ncbi:MAG: ABC transporter permease, partial [Lachnospiraceae bacterium]|nr:ABC transporter permease [Lachnospiraceae bacterium]
KDCLLTRSGYERMGVLQNATYYLNISDRADIDAFNEEVGEQFGKDINMTANVSSILAAVNVYTSLMIVIVIAVIILSLLIITFVLYLLVKTMLNNKKHDYGIMKALGFTTGQLILQTALSFMPIVMLSMIVGLVVSCLIINPLLAILLSGIGIVKCTFAIPIGLVTILGIGLVLFAFMMACLLSIKIKKIAPRELLVGE